MTNATTHSQALLIAISLALFGPLSASCSLQDQNAQNRTLGEDERTKRPANNVEDVRLGRV